MVPDLSCFPCLWDFPWRRPRVPSSAAIKSNVKIGKIVNCCSRLVKEMHDESHYGYLPLSQKESKPIEKDIVKMTQNIVQIIAGLHKVSGDNVKLEETEEELGGQSCQKANIKTQTRPNCDEAHDLPNLKCVAMIQQEQEEECLQKTMGSLSPHVQAAQKVEVPMTREKTLLNGKQKVVQVAFMDVLETLFPCSPELVLEISPFFEVVDFACFRRTSRRFASTKAFVRHLEYLLRPVPERDETFWAVAKYFDIQVPEIRNTICPMRSHPDTGFSILVVNINCWWKADPHTVLRVLESLRSFSFRDGQPFHARYLVTNFAIYSFLSGQKGQGCKSLRCLFAKDILKQMASDDPLDPLHACMALQWLQPKSFGSARGLGRFENEIVYSLLRLVRTRALHVDVRREAVLTLTHLLSSDAVKRYPYLARHLLRAKASASNDLLVPLDCLLEALSVASPNATEMPADPTIAEHMFAFSQRMACITM